MSESGFKNFETLESYIAKEQRMHINSRGLFSNILRRIGVASKVVSIQVQKAGIVDVLGARDNINIQGEVQMKLDEIANEVFKATFSWMPSIAGMASEEEETYTVFPRQDDYTGSRYIILFDPLDGSSNIDANVSVGTIFSIYRLKNDGKKNGGNYCDLTDFLQPGRDLAAAGYVIYGSGTVFVYTTGHGVHGFTLDPSIGEYVLSHENMTIPETVKCFSANETNYKKWDRAAQTFADHIRYGNDPTYSKVTSRYIGSLVSDFHRNLLYGGIYMYPGDAKTGKGKLRLLYECAPLSFIAEQAGGLGTTGKERILDVDPVELHQRVPFIVGNKKEVELYEKMVKDIK